MALQNPWIAPTTCQSLSGSHHHSVLCASLLHGSPLPAQCSHLHSTESTAGSSSCVINSSVPYAGATRALMGSAKHTADGAWVSAWSVCKHLSCCSADSAAAGVWRSGVGEVIAAVPVARIVHAGMDPRSVVHLLRRVACPRAGAAGTTVTASYPCPDQLHTSDRPPTDLTILSCRMMPARSRIDAALTQRR
jgi:hypothetical protein